ncbi:pyridoxal-dependent decarboxylase [Aureimonas ureilytica]|uniref:pyridoxal-dependent decarboxylase n=1 Tax=Aureimonas ureilytica TaxID=401562 RepID=UPI0009E94744|nr:pyridoxal-dependent decarboxylase [Aureimonas ureilytica]
MARLQCPVALTALVAELHVDAAYGGGLLFLRRFRSQLEGIACGDSVALDFHKMLFQPVSCGVLLVRFAAAFAPFALKADCLNPASTLRAVEPVLAEMADLAGELDRFHV